MAQMQQFPKHEMPFTRVELAVLAVRDAALEVLLVKRGREPEAGKWALPGGVVRIDLDADLEAAAQRVAEERLHRRLPNFDQVVTVGGGARDPRSPWAVSIVYASLVAPDFAPEAGKRISELAWRAVSPELLRAELAFDHATLVRQAIDVVRAQVAALSFPLGWLPAEFTVPELMALSEAILGHALDKVTFRRRLQALALVEEVKGKMRLEGAHRPAQVYRLAEPSTSSDA